MNTMKRMNVGSDWWVNLLYMDRHQRLVVYKLGRAIFVSRPGLSEDEALSSFYDWVFEETGGLSLQ